MMERLNEHFPRTVSPLLVKNVSTSPHTFFIYSPSLPLSLKTYALSLSLSVSHTLSLMGNHISDRSSGTIGKVVLSDGTVQEYEKPLTAAELMLEHPQQVVVELQSAVTKGKRLNPLPADEKLGMGKVYLMVPKRRGRPPALSPEEARRLLLTANSVLSSRRPILSTTTGCVPMLARLCTAREGFVVASRRDKVVAERREEVRKAEVLLGPEILEGLQPEFLSRQISGGKGWKPSLDTIKEKAAKEKVSHWLF